MATELSFSMNDEEYTGKAISGDKINETLAHMRSLKKSHSGISTLIAIITDAASGEEFRLTLV